MIISDVHVLIYDFKLRKIRNINLHFKEMEREKNVLKNVSYVSALMRIASLTPQNLF